MKITLKLARDMQKIFEYCEKNDDIVVSKINKINDQTQLMINDVQCKFNT